MVIVAPDVAKAAKAGQFIILRIDERGERVLLQLLILRERRHGYCNFSRNGQNHKAACKAFCRRFP
jgi:NAD(P)H-flavin reductase